MRPQYRIRQARAQAGLTEEEMADQLVRLSIFLQEPDELINGDAIRHWEAGGQIPNKRLMLLAAALAIPPRDLMAALDPTSLPEWVLLAPEACKVDNVVRREFLVFLLGLSVDPEHLMAGLAQRVRIDDRLIAQLQQVSRHLGSQFDKTPAGVFRLRAMEHFRLIKDLLEHRTSPELLSLAAETGALAGWASQIDGRPGESKRILREANAYASQAQHNDAWALIKLRTADMHSAVQAGGSPVDAPDRVIPLLQYGMEISSMPSLKALITLRLSEEMAALGDIEQSQGLMSQAFAYESLGDFFGVPWTRTAMNCFVGNIALLSRRPATAIGILEDALRTMPESTTSNRSSAMADMAAAHASQGDVDEACRLLSESWRIANAAGLEYRKRRIRGIRRQIRQESPAVSRLDEEMMS